MSLWLLEELSRVKALKLQQDVIDALPNEYDVGFKDDERLVVTLADHKPFTIDISVALSMTPKALAKKAMLGMMLPAIAELKATKRPGNLGIGDVWFLRFDNGLDDYEFTLASISGLDAPLRVICRCGRIPSANHDHSTIVGIGDVWSPDGLRDCIAKFTSRPLSRASTVPEDFK